jgi:hypothetical protein
MKDVPWTDFDVYLGARSEYEASQRLDQLRLEQRIMAWRWSDAPSKRANHKLAAVKLISPETTMLLRLALDEPDAAPKS